MKTKYKMKHRLIAMLMAGMLCLSCFAAPPAFATESNPLESSSTSEVSSAVESQSTPESAESAPETDSESTDCALPGFVDSKNEEKTERNAGYLVVSHSGGGMLRQGTRKGIRRTPANRGMRAHRIVKSLDISEDVCHGLCP